MNRLRLLLILWALLAPSVATMAGKFQKSLPKQGLICTDYTAGRVCILNGAGELVWEYPAPECNDLTLLPNGNLLFNTGNGVKEVTRDKKVVFPYDSPGGIYACQRLPNGDTFIGECNSGRLLEVAPDGTLRKEIRLLPQGTDGGHAYMRNARKLENGHYLVAHYGLDKVCEYDDKGSLVRAIAVHGGPHSVLGLKNGNILISCSDHNGDPGVIEVNPKGKIVWQLKKDDLPGIVLKFMTGMVVLPNGHLVLTNWLGHNHFGESAHVFEITRRKKVIWAYRDHSLLRTVSNVQLW